jgi:phosphonopyruvate decarboxylase
MTTSSCTPSAALDADQLLTELITGGIREFAWVPCSVTARLQSLASQDPRVHFVATTHEANLPGLAAGFWFATGRPALLHMQNSGLPNAADGCISLLGSQVYNIPALALITWRGWATDDDSEPHLAIGARTLPLAQAIFSEADAVFGDRSGHNTRQALALALSACRTQLAALLLSPAGLAKDPWPTLLPPPTVSQPAQARPRPTTQSTPIHRDDALRAIVDAHPDAAILFCNGYTSRAAQAVVDRPGNFYNIGYMGGTLAMGWALATKCPSLPVVVVDGDQNAQMSAFHENLAAEFPPNLSWYVLNNGIGASVGTAQSVPLSTQIRTLANIIDTLPDAPGSFAWPRVSPTGHGVAIVPPEKRTHTLQDLALGFHLWIQQQRISS